MNKNFTQACVAIIGMVGLVACTVLSFFMSEMDDTRNLLIGGLIASVGASTIWLFKVTNGVK